MPDTCEGSLEKIEGLLNGRHRRRIVEVGVLTEDLDSIRRRRIAETANPGTTQHSKVREKRQRSHKSLYDHRVVPPLHHRVAAEGADSEQSFREPILRSPSLIQAELCTSSFSDTSICPMTAIRCPWLHSFRAIS